jgi:hypothetical protein
VNRSANKAETTIGRYPVDGGDGDDAAAAELVAIVRNLAAELHPSRAGWPASLDARLEQDYGFDSLARVELLLRVEKAFGVAFPETVLAGAEISAR